MIAVDSFVRTPSTIDTIEKGNYVASIEKDCEGTIMAVSPRTGKVRVRVHGDRDYWVDPARLAVIPEDARVLDCHKCSGDGRYYFGGAVVNGVYTGQTGPCFGCEGNGRCTPQDRHRCRVYWNKYARIYA